MDEDKAKYRRRSYIKLNILSLFFTAVSFISVTLAWFAYSGLVTTQTEVNVKAWFIEFNNKGNAVSNDIVISLSDIYPGMDIVSETIDIKNSGDSDAMINYKIKSVRILDEEYDVTDGVVIQDRLSHEFPFHINMSLSDHFANAHDGKGNFTVSVSWPLDSATDVEDTDWGTKAYEFQKAEADKYAKDKNYQVRNAIEVKISLEAVQYVGEGDAPDYNYLLGGIKLYDVVNNQPCSEISNTCLKTYIIDKNNKLSDSSVTLLPDLYGTYVSGTYSNYDTMYNSLTNGWTVAHRKLEVKDILDITSTDVVSTMVVSDKISSQLVGYLGRDGRIDGLLNNVIKYDAHIRFKNQSFTYFSTSNCYWLNDSYNTDKQFALVKADDMFSRIYAENKTSTCKIVPVIEVSKAKFSGEESSS